jgi:hypothetical protein
MISKKTSYFEMFIVVAVILQFYFSHARQACQPTENASHLYHLILYQGCKILRLMINHVEIYSDRKLVRSCLMTCVKDLLIGRKDYQELIQTIRVCSRSVLLSINFLLSPFPIGILNYHHLWLNNNSWLTRWKTFSKSGHI